MSYPKSNEINHMYQAYALCTFIFALLHLTLIGISANPKNHPEEDSILNLPEVTDPPDSIKRKERMFQNHLENVPIHLCILWGAFIIQIGSLTDTNYGQDEVRALTAIVILYTVTRVFYTIFYKFEIQPARSICFLLSQLCILIAGIVMCRSAFKVNY